MNDDPNATARDRVHAALADIVSDDGPSMLTRWICLIELISDSGERQIWNLHNEELSMSDQIGMLEFQSRCLQPEIRPYSA